MEEAHRQHIRTTATMTFGMVETFAERVEHFQRIRDVQDKADPDKGSGRSSRLSISPAIPSWAAGPPP